MKNVCALLFAISFFVGCPTTKHDCEYPPLEITPRGYWVSIPELQAGVSRAEVMYWLEQRIDEWVASHPERASDELYGIALGYPYIIYDNWTFPCEQSPTKRCAGRITYSPCPQIELALYNKGKSPDYPFWAPPHTIIWGGDLAVQTGVASWNDGYWYFGWLPLEGGLPATGHELDHALYGSFHN